MIFFNLPLLPQTQEIVFFLNKKKMNQTKSLKVSIGGADTQAQGAVHWQQQHLPLLFLQAQGVGERAMSRGNVLGQSPQMFDYAPTRPRASLPLSFYFGRSAPQKWVPPPQSSPDIQPQKFVHTLNLKELRPLVVKYSKCFLISFSTSSLEKKARVSRPMLTATEVFPQCFVKMECLQAFELAVFGRIHILPKYP